MPQETRLRVMVQKLADRLNRKDRLNLGPPMSLQLMVQVPTLELSNHGRMDLLKMRKRV